MAAREIIRRARRVALDAIRTVRMPSKRQVFWFQGPPYNFGDWIGPYLYRARTGRSPVFCKPSNRGLTTVHLTVGSLAHVIHENCIV